MSTFAPHPVHTPYDFRIAQDPLGHWAVYERQGLSGGVFLTRKDAVRFAMAETGGDASHVHAARSGRARRSARQ